MVSLPLSRLLLVAGILAAVLGWAGVARVAGGSDEPAVEILNASGTLQVTNSGAGQAIFQAAGLAPGGSVTGTVQLSNTGTLAGDLSLAQLDVQDQPGPNGGLLSSAVQLAVQDITGGSSIPVFSGQLGGLGTRSLGSLGAGGSRTYRFTATLPNTGTPAGPTAGDNAYEGSRVTVRYVWTATAPDETGGGTGGGETGGGSGGGGTGGGGTGGGGTGGPSVAPVVKIKVNSKKLLKRGVLDVSAACDIACRVSTYAQLPKAKGARKAAKTRARTALLGTPGKAGRIRLKLSAKSKRQLMAALRKKRRVVLQVKLTARPAAGGPSRAYTRKVSVKRPKPRRR